MVFSMVWHVTAKIRKKATVWRKTRTANLYEHIQSGRYYAVAWVNGKQVFKSLKTDSAEHAKIKLPAVLKEFGKMGCRKENVLPPETSIGRLSERYLESVRTSVKNKASTAHYREQTVKALFRTWPELKTFKPKDITDNQCLEWAKRFSTMKSIRGHNQKTDRETTSSPTRYNNTVDTLRHIFHVAIDGGLLFENPAADGYDRGRKIQALHIATVLRTLFSNSKEGKGLIFRILSLLPQSIFVNSSCPRFDRPPCLFIGLVDYLVREIF